MRRQNILSFLSNRQRDGCVFSHEKKFEILIDSVKKIDLGVECFFEVAKVVHLLQLLRSINQSPIYRHDGVRQSVEALLRIIPSEQQIKLAQRSLSRGIYFRPALIDKKNAETITTQLNEMRELCHSILDVYTYDMPCLS